MKIRPYRHDDYAAIRKNLEDAGMFDPVWDGQENVDSLSIEDPANVLVAEQEGVLIGSLFIDQFGSRVAFIYRLIVDPAYRNQGVASELLKAAHENLKQRGIHEVALFVDDENKVLQDFYSKRGYQKGAHRYRTMWRAVGYDE